MNLIASVDKNWGIGYQGRLLCRIPEDMRWFKEHTTGKVVVMGRATLESLPGSRPLAERVNIVISAEASFFAPGCMVVRTPEELLQLIERYDTNDVFVIGGASIYAMMMPYCHYAYITKMDRTFPADRHLANLDKQPGWQLLDVSEDHWHEEIRFNHCLYKNTISPDEEE